MKLELKNLAPYLPYGLKVFRDTGETSEILELSSGKIMLWQDGYYESFKPILHPLSDLTKEIEHNGEIFVPINTIKIFTDLNHFEYVERFIYDEETIGLLPYWVMELLLEWNFDIFGLIPHGLAVDINTLNK